ncbi:MAG: imidazole glycerol phosphate synthase subunit HisH [Bacteroidales bacterium]|nr:imidazole glycerol phosphate synthase subunit HisH [Bacteroidales bacterium]
MKVAIVKYNAGNIQSVSYALNRLGITPIITDDVNELQTADKVIFPGVGEARAAMDYLNAKGLVPVLKSLKQPFLGICLGMQLMCNHSEERDAECLGIFDVQVKKFPALEKVPHMGWNTIHSLQSKLLTDLPENAYMYFVHSYYAEICPDTICSCNYILDFSAGLQKDNFFAFQFHPEKSGTDGEQILKNFINI